MLWSGCQGRERDERNGWLRGERREEKRREERRDNERNPRDDGRREGSIARLEERADAGELLEARPRGASPEPPRATPAQTGRLVCFRPGSCPETGEKVVSVRDQTEAEGGGRRQGREKRDKRQREGRERDRERGRRAHLESCHHGSLPRRPDPLSTSHGDEGGEASHGPLGCREEVVGLGGEP